MVEELPDPILIQVTVPLPIAMVFSGFTDPTHLKGWLASDAAVERRVGGRFRCTVDGPEPFEVSGEIRTLTADVDIGFDWQAPGPFAALMNGPPAATHVYVRLQDSPEGIDVTLEHAGWGLGPEWEEARSWHFHFWDERLHRMKDYLLKAAYG